MRKFIMKNAQKFHLKRLLKSGDVNGPMPPIKIANPGHGPLKITFEPLPWKRIADVWVAVVENAYPFVATDPAGLLGQY